MNKPFSKSILVTVGIGPGSIYLVSSLRTVSGQKKALSGGQLKNRLPCQVPSVHPLSGLS